MRSRSVIWIVLFLYTALSFSQKNEAGNVLLEKANEVLYDDPVQTLKIGTHLLHNSTDGKEKAQTATLLAKGNLIMGNYTQAIANVQLALTAAKASGEKEILFRTFLLAGEIYSYSDLFEISKQYRVEAGKIARGNPVLEKQSEAYDLFVAEGTPDISAFNAFLQKTAPEELDNYSFITKGTPLQLMARTFEKVSLMDSARVYYEKSFRELNKKNTGNYWKMIALLDYGTYFFDKKDYAHAIVLLQQSLEKGKKIRNPSYLMAVNEKLSDCYLALGNKNMFGQFRQEATVAGSDYETRTTLAANFAFETLQKEKEQKILQAKAFRQNTYLGMGISALVILLFWLFVKWQFATRISHTRDIINYLRLIQKTTEKPEFTVKSISKTLSIPKETEDLLLSKLEKFERGKKYLSKDMSLAQMAALFDTNTKYLSEVVNKYKGKNINLYINELRIKYIVDKLKNNPKYLNYKVSYLAEECGFSSHSSFSAVFKSTTGITPNVFIQFLSEDIHADNTTQNELTSIS